MTSISPGLDVSTTGPRVVPSASAVVAAGSSLLSTEAGATGAGAVGPRQVEFHAGGEHFVGEEPEFERVTFCLLGVASPSDLIQDTRKILTAQMGSAASAYRTKPMTSLRIFGVATGERVRLTTRRDSVIVAVEVAETVADAAAMGTVTVAATVVVAPQEAPVRWLTPSNKSQRCPVSACARFISMTKRSC